MHKLKPISALGAAQPQIDQIAGLTIAERSDLALASIAARQGQGEACMAAAQSWMQADLPSPGQGHLGQTYSCFWMGPEQWMVSADQADHEDLASEIKQSFGATASVSEQSGGWCRFDLKGAQLGAVLERLCNVDFAAMETGDVSRSRLEHLGCFIWCLQPGSEVAILGPRSSAGSLHHALVAAARSAL